MDVKKTVDDGGRTSVAERLRSSGEEASLLDVVNALLLHRKLMVFLPLIVVAVVAAYSLSRPYQWTSIAAFIPENRSNAGALAGMAAQFGFAMPTGEAGESPTFYSQLIQSRSVLGAAVDSIYTLHEDGQTRSVLLANYLAPGAMPEVRRAVAINLLRRSVHLETSRETGIVRVAVSTRNPALSRQIAAMLLDLVHEFNLERRQHQASAERRFVEERLEQARAELMQAEDVLRRFQEGNRTVESPRLLLERNRLQHDVALREQIVTSLAESFERARIDEVRNIPLITILDEPETPGRPEGRGTVMRVLLAFLLGVALAAMIAVARTSLSAAADTRSDARLFRKLRKEAIADVARPFAALQSFRGPRRDGKDRDRPTVGARSFGADD